MTATLVKNLITKNRVAVFSKSFCPFCELAKNVLKQEGVAQAAVLELDERKDGLEIQVSFISTSWISFFKKKQMVWWTHQFSYTLCRAGFSFSVLDHLFLKSSKKLNKFGHNAWESGPVNTVTTSFKIPMTGQLTEMSQRQKTVVRSRYQQPYKIKFDWRCNHATWSLEDLWAAFPWVVASMSCLANLY